ncbi:MAG: DEAD/DEAH box helicase [Polyangiaceae bacterium]
MTEDLPEPTLRFTEELGPALTEALQKKGFTALTAVQEVVLDPAHADRDLRITSQTGSGKTVAIGLAIRDLVTGDAAPPARGIARPHAIVVAPTRELAKQVEEELSWLYAPLRLRVTSVTGGASLRDELRALAGAPGVIVGTPGRLLDHLDRGSIDASGCAAVVLDEADRLLDMGFREELERIFAHVPETRRTHLVSATFPREVRSLADSVQTDPVHLEGTRLGQANADIDHVIHLVDQRDRLGAIVNLLLANPDEQVLIFARTRADVADLAASLVAAGFSATSLSGEMEQPARDRALAAFKRGDLRALVATDVAARGIDVQDIARVLHADPPGDADTYTHRSGRTGRAGKKGISSLLVPPTATARALRILTRAKVVPRFEDIPGADDIRKAQDDRLLAHLTSAEPTPADTDERALSLAARLAAAGDIERTIARLLQTARKATGPQPVAIRNIAPPRKTPKPTRRSSGEDFESGQNTPTSPRPRREAPTETELFQVTWGEAHGADTRRLLAMLCRRGGIESSDVGSIRIGRIASTVEIASSVAEAFAEAAAEIDTRDPRIQIRRFTPGAPARKPARAPRPEGDHPSWRPGPPNKPARAANPEGEHPSWRPGPPRDTAVDADSPSPSLGDRPPKKLFAKRAPAKKEPVSPKSAKWVRKPSQPGGARPKKRKSS